VSRHLPIRPDAMPLREALRGLRFMLRRGGATFAETVTVDSLPKPAAAFAGAVLRGAGGLARNVDEVASELAKSVLGGHDTVPVNLRDLPWARDADVQYAAAVYVALTQVLDRLGAGDVFVSEAAARSVFTRCLSQDSADTTALTAAKLTLDLLDSRVMRGSTGRDTARVQGAALQSVAVFAVVLWLQSTRSEPENDAALDAAADLALALADDVAAACGARDLGQITALYGRFAAHV